MPAHDYDMIVAGGGLGGSALAKVMAYAGARVLVLEQEARFKDRIRGEFLPPWGVAEARRLDLEHTLQTCGSWAPYLETGLGEARNLIATTPQALPALGFSHPEIQEALFQAAATAGAHVRRGVTVTAIEPGNPPRIKFYNSEGTETLSARIVVASDGRNSAARKWAGFAVTRQSHPFLFAGVLLTGLAMPHDLAHYFFTRNRYSGRSRLRRRRSLSSLPCLSNQRNGTLARGAGIGTVS